MTEIPHLPPGAVGVLAAAGSVGLLCFAAATIVLAVKRRGRDAAWAGLALGVGASTAAAHAHPPWHVVLSAITLAVALRNAVCFDRAPRWLSAAGGLGWLVAVVLARLVFH